MREELCRSRVLAAILHHAGLFAPEHLNVLTFNLVENPQADLSAELYVFQQLLDLSERGVERFEFVETSQRASLL